MLLRHLQNKNYSRYWDGELGAAINLCFEITSEGQVKNLDASRKRPVHAVHFDKGEFLKGLNS